MAKWTASLAIGLGVMGLSACASGGGGAPSSPTPPPPPPGFTSWSAVKPPATVTVPGLSQEITYTANANGTTTVSPPSPVMDSTFVETLDASGATTALKLQNASRTVSFDTANGDTIGHVKSDPRLLAATSADQARIAVASDPAQFGWDYQSFGVWETGVGTGTGSAGASSVGALTNGASIPTSGSATFTGAVGALYLDPAGVDHLVGANLTVNVDFLNRQAALSTGAMTDLIGGDAFAGTAISGTLTYGGGQNSLTGTLTTANGRLSGAATARFYGPAAQEIGGVFTLTPNAGSGFERLGGAFGARRGP